jgi:hypothetical protein
MSKSSRVPGTFKNMATFESKTKGLPGGKDKALKDTRVLDEDYSYTSEAFPGKMSRDPNLSRAEGMHKIHKPLTSTKS